MVGGSIKSYLLKRVSTVRIRPGAPEDFDGIISDDEKIGSNAREIGSAIGELMDSNADCDERTMVQPDVGIVCDTSKIKRFGIYGAPDFVVEVVSSSTKKKDYALKLSKYMEAGVREYWIMDFAQEKVLVYFFESDVYPVIYGFDKPVPVNIYNGELKIDFTNIVRWLKEGME